MKCDKELLKGSTESLILSLLSRSPMHGYQIIKELRERSGEFFRLGEGTIYPALHKLEKEGLIRGEWQTTPGGRERKFYHITEKGRKALEEKVEMWRRFSAAVNMILDLLPGKS